MVMDDTENKRKLFFYSYTIVSTFTFFFYMYSGYTDMEEEKAWIEPCAELKTKNQLHSMHADSIEEC